MEVKGAYTTIQDFLFTYKECAIQSSFSDSSDTSWSFEANRTIKIPDYQREFRWKEKQLEDLYNDIERDHCYLGQIAVSHKNGDNCYQLVDGQQRITSIIILLTVLIRQFYVYDDMMNLRQFELHKVENNPDSSTPRLSFTANSFSEFQDFICQIYNIKDPLISEFNCDFFDPPKTDYYNQTGYYIDACSIFNKLILSSLNQKELTPEKLDFVKDFIKKIFKIKISVVVFEGDSIGESEKIFLDINEKGLRLDNEDILKAYYFQSITSDSGDLALTTWTTLKKNYFSWQNALNNNTKLSLDTLMNFMLQVALFTDQTVNYDFEKFDNDLRYGTHNKKHICKLFIDSQLQNAFEKASEFLEILKNLIELTPNSQYYIDYLPRIDSTSRQIFHILLNNVCKADMKIGFIVLCKTWWIRKNRNENLNLDDIIQLFSFYVISNISGLKKEKSLVSKAFITSKSITELYHELFSMEKQLLSESSEKSLTLKQDQEKAEWLSFNIQMFYNDFYFNPEKHCWKIKISNQLFLGKYSANRKDYIKDHFIIQNGQKIKLYDGSDFSITQSMTILRKRAYNFIYHKDTYANLDFITRLNMIFKKAKTTPLSQEYGGYEIAYFKFLSEQVQLYYKRDSYIPTWDEAIEQYRGEAQRVFPLLISLILQERCPTWNREIGNYLSSQIVI